MCDQRGRGKQDIDHCVRVKTFRTQCLKHPVSVSVVRKITTHPGAAVAEKPRQAVRRVPHPRVAAVSSAAQCCLSEIREWMELLLGRSEEVISSKGTSYAWSIHMLVSNVGQPHSCLHACDCMPRFIFLSQGYTTLLSVIELTCAMPESNFV